ncbi:hypothetical protein ACYJ1Y_17460 [Natrialbaceae archaeon A-gly3]
MFTDHRGYTTYHDEVTGNSVRVHQLAAIVDNDPHLVFSSDTETHHSVAIPQEFGVKLDIPANVSVLDRTEHRKLHSDGYQSPPIESVLESSEECEEETKHPVSTQEGTGTQQEAVNV